MDIEEDSPVLLRALNPALHFIGFGIAFEVDNITAVFLRGQNLLDCGVPHFVGSTVLLEPPLLVPLLRQ